MSIEQTLRAEKKLTIVKAEGDEIVAEMRAGTRMDDAAQQRGLEIRHTDTYSRMDFVPGLGRLNAAVGAGFGLNEGEVSSVIVANNNAFSLEMVSYFPADSTAFESGRLAQRNRVVATIQQTRLQDWLQGLRAAAKIIDRRAEVLNVDPAQQQHMPLVF